MRFKYLKYLAFALGGASTAVATGALYLYATFDGARLATDLSHFTKQRHQRTLRFDGAVELAMFPRLELRLPAMSLSGRNGDGECLGIERGTLGVRLLPLLARQVVVDRVEADGLRLALRRGKDGKLSAADLLTPLPAEAPLEFDVDRLAVTGGVLNWIDEASGRNFALSDINLGTSRLGRKADGRLELSARLTQATPLTDVRIELQTGYRLDGDAGHQARSAHLAVRGALADRAGVDVDLALAELLLPTDGAPEASGLSFVGKDKSDGRALELRVTAPRVVLGAAGPEAATAEAALRMDGKGYGGQLRARIAGLVGKGNLLAVEKLSADIDWKTPAGRLAGSLGGAASWQADSRVLDIPALAGELGLTAGKPGATPLKIVAQLGGKLDFGRDNGGGKLDLRFDESHLQGSWSLPKLSVPSLGFDLDADRFDADRHLGPIDGATRIDAAALAGLDADGVLKIASLKLGGLRLERLRLPLALHGGKLATTAYTGNLYGGTLEGTASLAEGNRLQWRSYVQGANLAPLLRDMTGREPASGALNLFIDVSGAGQTLADVRQSLVGQARLRLRGGVLRGIDATAALKEWRGAIQARQPARRPYRDAESTPVGELTVGFEVAGGYARSSDLQARSPTLAIIGGGSIDLAGPGVDALARLSLLAVAPVDMPLLGSLRGAAVPVRARGALGKPEWQVDPSAAPLAPVKPVALAQPASPPPRPVVKPAPLRPAAAAAASASASPPVAQPAPAAAPVAAPAPAPAPEPGN